MKEIFEGIWIWSWFSEEKGYFFNGTLVADGAAKILIDPVRTTDKDYEFLKKQAPFGAIYLTNKDHERIASSLRREFEAPVWIHEEDVPYLKEKPDHTFREADTLACGIRVIHLLHQKSPGESAFYLAARKILILGDALIGNPPKKLRLLPAAKYQDIRKAQAALRRLFSLCFETVLVGDGACILENGFDALDEFFAS